MTDDRRMHGDDTPGLNPGRGHERHEEPLDGMVEHAPAPADGGSDDGDMRDRHQPSALGGETATRSGTAEVSKEG